jgi:hypothetical protein
MTTPFPLRLAAALLAGVVASACAQASQSDADAGNFQRCLQGDAWCDLEQLTEREHAQIVEASGAIHLEHCLAGKRCNSSLLSASERARVEAAVAGMNLQACLDGRSACRRDALDADQRERVAAADLARNVERCLDGLPGCEADALTRAQRQAARERYLERNLAACQQGFASACRPQDLTAEQAVFVHRRRLEGNLYLCTYALIGCVDELLTPEQRVRIRATRSAAAQ